MERNIFSLPIIDEVESLTIELSNSKKVIKSHLMFAFLFAHGNEETLKKMCKDNNIDYKELIQTLVGEFYRISHYKGLDAEMKMKERLSYFTREDKTVILFIVKDRYLDLYNLIDKRFEEKTKMFIKEIVNEELNNN